MTAPLHTRPFHLEHARAGAPYGCADGALGEILKFTDRALFGTYDNNYCREFAIGWEIDGSHMIGGIRSTGMSLVMLPLGTIEDKPVFWDSELEHLDGTAVAGHVAHHHGMEYYRWPSPKPAYPETLMAEAQVWNAVDEVRNAPALRAFINSALRHAVDAGQLLLPAHVADRGAARDLVVANAMRRACCDVLEQFNDRHTFKRSDVVAAARLVMNHLDVSAIVGKVNQ